MIINGKEYTRENLGKIFDYAMLNHDVTREQVQEHVRKGIYYNVNGIHCNPVWVPMIADMLEGTGIETGICPAFPFGAADVEDIDTDGEDHIYDELRYVCMKNPISPRLRPVEKPRPYNPLDTYQDNQYDRYEFYRRY